MLLDRRNNRRKYATTLLVIALLITPIIALIHIPPVSAQPTTVLTSKWAHSNLGTNWEGGLVIGDVTGDGIEDVVVAGGETVYVLNGNNGNTIASYTNSRIYRYCQPQLYDVDGDGLLDILVPLYYRPGLAVVQYDGSTTLHQMWVADTQGATGSGSVMAKPVAGDIDGDGHLDIFIASQDVAPAGGYDGTICRLDYQGNILYTTFTWRACSGGLSLADTDNDGVFELYQGDRQMGYTDGGYGKGARSFWADNLTERWNRLDFLSSSQAPVIADVNGDGIKDVLTGMYREMNILNSTNGEMIQKWSDRTMSVHYGFTVYDIDGDGHLELLCSDGDHDDDAYSDVYDLVTGELKAELSLAGGDWKWSPVVADISPSHPGMEIICAPNGTSIDGWRGVLMIYDSNFESIQNVTAGMSTQLGYPVVQDIDGDGYLEVVVGASSGSVYAFDTAENAPAPGYNEDELPGTQRIRSEVTYYGEARLDAAEHTIMPWEENYWTAPLVAFDGPADNALAVPISTSQLHFKLREHQSEPLTYSVTTSPDIGSTSGSITTGTYDWNYLSVDVSGMAYDTTYKWTVTADDGSEVTSRTYTFRTELAPNPDNSPPTQDTPTLTSVDGMTKSTFTCSNQTTTDTNGDDVTNIYRWTVNDEPVAQLLLPFDTRNETSTEDYSGFGNDGQVIGATWVPNGITGGAYSFDGKDDAIIISDGGDGYFNDHNYPTNHEELGGYGDWNALTVEAWIYLSQYNNGSRIVAKIPSYAIGFQSGTTSRLYASVWPMTFEVADPEQDPNESSLDREQSVSANVDIELNTWYQVAFTYENGVGLKLYLNGELVGQSSTNDGPVKISRGEPLYIGRLVQPFAGMIDEVRLYNYAQPAEQIYNSYMETKDGNTSSSSFIPFGIGAKGDMIGCDVIPTDSYEDGVTSSAPQVEIINTPPVASNLQLYPIRNREYRLDSENLVASYEYYDADGDADSGTQIQWWQNDVHQPGLDNQMEVPASSTSVGDTWRRFRRLTNF